MTEKPNVALIGPYPPPVGGVSVHVKRLAGRLRGAGWATTVYCQPLETPDATVVPTPVRFSWKRWTLARFWSCRDDLIHCHTELEWAVPLVLLKLRARDIVFTLHADTLPASYLRCGLVVRAAIRLLLRNRDVVWICVNASIAEKLVTLGAAPSAVRVIPAYLADTDEDVAEDLPVEALSFLRDRSPKLVSYAFRQRSHEGDSDDYGLDLAVRALALLKKRRPQAGLLLSISLGGDGSYVDSLRKLAGELGVADDVYLVVGSRHGGRQLWRAADVYLRSTRTDGDSLAVREAVAFGLPVVASDVAARPGGVTLFISGDAVSLAGAIEQALSRPAPRDPPRETDDADYFDQILSTYRDVLSKRDY